MGTFQVFLAVLCVVYASAQRKNDNAPQGEKVVYPNDFLRADNFHPHHHGYHNHHHHGSGSRVYENGPFTVIDSNSRVDEDEDDVYEYNNETIPLEFLKTLSEHNVTDLLLNFVDGYEDVPEVENRFGDDNSERRKAELPKSAACMPELQTVQIAHSDDPSVVYIPSCTRVERCGGCCSHERFLSCQPTETEQVSYQVVKTQYSGTSLKLKYFSKEIVVVERHTKCKCDCKIKQENCTQYQKYNKGACSCDCTNIDEKKKCSKAGNKKLWNSDLCVCQCREEMQCSTGSYFDERECRCLPNPMKRRFANYELNKNDS